MCDVGSILLGGTAQGKEKDTDPIKDLDYYLYYQDFRVYFFIFLLLLSTW